MNPLFDFQTRIEIRGLQKTGQLGQHGVQIRSRRGLSVALVITPGWGERQDDQRKGRRENQLVDSHVLPRLPVLTRRELSLLHALLPADPAPKTKNQDR